MAKVDALYADATAWGATRAAQLAGRISSTLLAVPCTHEARRVVRRAVTSSLQTVRVNRIAMKVPSRIGRTSGWVCGILFGIVACAPVSSPHTQSDEVEEFLAEIRMASTRMGAIETPFTLGSDREQVYLLKYRMGYMCGVMGMVTVCDPGEKLAFADAWNRGQEAGLRQYERIRTRFGLSF